MTKLEELKDILHKKNASLVVLFKNGEIKEYYQDRITDIKNILTENSESLVGASVADRVIGKTAASVLAVAGIKELYTDVISSLAIRVLEDNDIKYEYLEKVDYIKNKDNTGMCPMENKFKNEINIHKIYNQIFAM